MNEVTAIAQGRSFEREQAPVVRQAYGTTLFKLGLKPAQDMTREIALEMSQEIAAQMMPFLQHRFFSQQVRR
jgi:hypothetical protein